jgi:hypothetical protein
MCWKPSEVSMPSSIAVVFFCAWVSSGLPRRRWRPRSRLGGCLMWVVLLILILIVLSVMFGGFQKGTKAGSLNHSPATITFAQIALRPALR